VDVDDIVRRARLPATAIDEDVTVVDIKTLHAFFDAAERVTGDVWLGLNVSARMARGQHGLLEFIARSASTVRDALAAIARHSALLNDVIVTTFAVEKDLGIFKETIPGVPQCVGRHGNEYFVAAMIHYLRHGTSAPCIPERVWLAHAPPSDVSALARHLGTKNIEFCSNENGLAFHARTLDLPLGSVDPELFALLDRQAEQARRQRPTELPLVAELRDKIRAELARGATIERVASKLGTTPRTLQRRLGEHGTTFVAELDAVREELAKAYVADPRLALAEVAFRLGYADERAFLRAFKRWTRETPKAFRARGTSTGALPAPRRRS
jgi:AraC-like DNA-binding protein